MNFGRRRNLNNHLERVQNNETHFSGQRTFDVAVKLGFNFRFRYCVVKLTSANERNKRNVSRNRSRIKEKHSISHRYGIWSLRQRNLSDTFLSFRRLIRSFRADPVPRMHSSSRSFISAVFRKLCVLVRFTGCRFWPLYSKLGMQTFSTCSI